MPNTDDKAAHKNAGEGRAAQRVEGHDLLALHGSEESEMTDELDYWAADDFEDTVAAALIACYETKVRKNRGAAPADRLTDDRVALLRAEGPYIASGSRWLEVPDDDVWRFDLVNDKLPLHGLHAFRPGGLVVAVPKLCPMTLPLKQLVWR